MEEEQLALPSEPCMTLELAKETIKRIWKLRDASIVNRRLYDACREIIRLNDILRSGKYQLDDMVLLSKYDFETKYVSRESFDAEVKRLNEVIEGMRNDVAPYCVTCHLFCVKIDGKWQCPNCWKGATGA